MAVEHDLVPGGGQVTRQVVILESQLKQYRRAFLGELAARLRRDDIVLKVAYSPPNQVERTKSDNVTLPPDLGVEVPGAWLLGDRVFVQLAWRAVRDADLVVMEQGNKQLFNYFLVGLSQLGKKRVAYFGHGYNHQARSRTASEWLKRKLLTRIDWWFAYTDGVGRYLTEHGVDPDTITVVQNTIDTRELAEAVRAMGDGERRAVRRRLSISDRARVGLFCGSLYADKKLELLIAAARRIRERRPDFELVIVGDGPARDAMRAAAAELPFVHYVGPAFGPDRAAYFAISDAFLIPGLVGLAIVDAFAVGLPVFTTDIPIHSPEIEYLEPGINGLMTAHDDEAYAGAVCEVLDDPRRLARMRDAARATAARLTLGHMVEAFATGISRCLRARA
ncbi:MAG: glycosyltransferase family 4 protein [Deltaproteobacteria bacterium]|nr:MAG: glycosyltransferase family 4 protein [Deltaproteobacteria bacterium]